MYLVLVCLGLWFSSRAKLKVFQKCDSHTEKLDFMLYYREITRGYFLYFLFLFTGTFFLYFWLLHIVRVHCFFEGHPFKFRNLLDKGNCNSMFLFREVISPPIYLFFLNPDLSLSLLLPKRYYLTFSINFFEKRKFFFE